jgi:hypothetical protein
MAKKTPAQISRDHKTIQDSLRKLAKVAKSQKEVWLGDNLSTGVLEGIEEQKFVPVNLSKLLQYIADLM